MIPRIPRGEVLQWYLICTLVDPIFRLLFQKFSFINTNPHISGIAVGDDNLVTKVMLRSANKHFWRRCRGGAKRL